MQGYLLKHSGGFLHKTWQRRYIELYSTRLVWREEQSVCVPDLSDDGQLKHAQQPIKHEILYSDVTKLEEVSMKGQKAISFITERKVYIFRTEVWHWPSRFDM